jgi:hypothetical protein
MSRCIDPHFLDLGTSWRRVVSIKLQPLYHRRKSPQYPMHRRLAWTPEQVWTRLRNFLTPPGLELRPIGRPVSSQSLYRLRYPGPSEKATVKKESRMYPMSYPLWGFRFPAYIENTCAIYKIVNYDVTICTTIW